VTAGARSAPMLRSYARRTRSIRASASAGVETCSTPCTSHVPSPTTGRPVRKASATSDSVPWPPPIATRVGRAHDEAVAQLAQAGRDRDLHPPVRGVAVLARQDAERHAAARARPAAGGLHDPAEAAGHHDRAGRGEAGPDLLGGLELGC
jgi:hypothetical protein